MFNKVVNKKSRKRISKLLLASTMIAMLMALTVKLNNVEAVGITVLPTDIDVDSDGKFYIADSINKKVFIADGNVVAGKAMARNQIDISNGSPRSIFLTDYEIAVGIIDNSKKGYFVLYNKATGAQQALIEISTNAGEIRDIVKYGNDYYVSIFEQYPNVSFSKLVQINGLNYTATVISSVRDQPLLYEKLAVANNKLWHMQASGKGVANVQNSTEMWGINLGGSNITALNGNGEYLYSVFDNRKIVTKNPSSLGSTVLPNLVNNSTKNIVVANGKIYTVEGDIVNSYSSQDGSYIETITFQVDHLPTAAPTLTGLTQVGETLTATSRYYDADGDPDSGTTYAFYRYNPDGTNETVAQAASPTKTYTVQAADVGKVIKVKVIPKNNSGTGTVAVSAATAVIIDADKPVITLIGQQTVVVNKGELYTELGATVTDLVDTNLQPQITYTKNNTSVPAIDTTRAGTYTVHYNVSDKAGNQADEVTRMVMVLIFGDGNGDGVLSPTDALMVYQVVAGKISLTAEQKQALDMNGDGKVDGADAQLIMKAYLGKN